MRGGPQPVGQRQLPYRQGAGGQQGHHEQGHADRHGQVDDEHGHGARGHRGEGGEEQPLPAEDEQDGGGPHVQGLSGGEGVGERRPAGHGQRRDGAQDGSDGGADEQGPPGGGPVAEAEPGVGAVGQGLVPDPADERPGEQGQRPGRQAEPVLGAFEERRAQQVGQAGQGEDDPAQQAGGEGDPPGVGGGPRLREGAGHAGVELLGEGEGVVAAVGEPDVLVRHAVGFEDGGDLVGVDGGGDEHVEAFGQFVHRVGGGPGIPGARPGDRRERAGAGARS